jgi:hypothetical protein
MCGTRVQAHRVERVATCRSFREETHPQAVRQLLPVGAGSALLQVGVTGQSWGSCRQRPTFLPARGSVWPAFPSVLRRWRAHPAGGPLQTGTPATCASTSAFRQAASLGSFGQTGWPKGYAEQERPTLMQVSQWTLVHAMPRRVLFGGRPGHTDISQLLTCRGHASLLNAPVTHPATPFPHAVGLSRAMPRPALWPRGRPLICGSPAPPA